MDGGITSAVKYPFRHSRGPVGFTLWSLQHKRISRDAYKYIDALGGASAWARSKNLADWRDFVMACRGCRRSV